MSSSSTSVAAAGECVCHPHRQLIEVVGDPDPPAPLATVPRRRGGLVRNELRDRRAGLADHDFLTALHALQQAGEVGLGLVDVLDLNGPTLAHRDYGLQATRTGGAGASAAACADYSPLFTFSSRLEGAQNR